MWNTFDEAAFGLKSDGYTRVSLYKWSKVVSGRTIYVEIEWRGQAELTLWPVLKD
jgi:hypothetical protein